MACILPQRNVEKDLPKIVYGQFPLGCLKYRFIVMFSSLKWQFSLQENMLIMAMKFYINELTNKRNFKNVPELKML